MVLGRRGWVVGIGLLSSWVGAAAPQPKLWTESPHQRIARERNSLANVAKAVMPAVVSITTLQQGKRGRLQKDPSDEDQRGLGSGFIIHSDGYVLTSSHVVENASEIFVSVTSSQGMRREYPATVIGKDAPTDVALLKIQADKPLPVLPLGSTDLVELADWVAVLGSPFGLDHSVTVGVVSSKNRGDINLRGTPGYFNYLQTDASINPGNSGGPIVDSTGTVIAIANAMNVSGQGIGFAIPIDIAKAVLPELRSRGTVRRGWIGLSIQNLEGDLAVLLDSPDVQGVRVTEVVEKSPAFEAGLRNGDIISQVDGIPLSEAHVLRWKVATKGIGRSIELKVWRNGGMHKRTVKLAESPASDSRAVDTSAGASIVELGSAR